jgi:hypothetical protein
MDSLDAQCFLVGLAEGEACVPPLWRHDRSGALSWSFGEGGSWYSWSPDYVVEIAQRWRDSGRNEPPESVQRFLDAHRRLEEIAGKAGHGNPDAIVHDLDLGEVRAIWFEQKVAVVVDQIGGPQGHPPSSSSA